MGAIDMGLKEEELSPLVQSWRSANPHIVQFWWQVDAAVKKAIKERVSVTLKNIRFQRPLPFLCQTADRGEPLWRGSRNL